MAATTQLLELDGLYHYFYGKEKVSAKLEPGNANYELAWGCAASSTIWRRLGSVTGHQAIERAFEAIAAHEAALGEQLLSWLRARNDVRIIGERGSDARTARADHLLHRSKARLRRDRRPASTRRGSASATATSTPGG